MIKAIETEYNGYRFRSRLEARWAVFFDALGIEYEYEKEGYDLGELGWYLPDFWLPKLEMFIEIKGQEPTEEEKDRIYKLSKESGFEAYILTTLPEENIIYSFELVEASEQKNEITTTEGIVRCPVCGLECVHFFDALNTTWRGGERLISITMRCEDGHGWETRLGAHGGITFFDVTNIRGKTERKTDINGKLHLSSFQVSCASNAAKSARFEYGEKPHVCRIEPINEFPEYTKPSNMDVYTWNTLMNSALGYEIDDLYGNDLDQIRALNRELFKRLEKRKDEEDNQYWFEHAIDKDDARDRKKGIFDF